MASSIGFQILVGWTISSGALVVSSSAWSSQTDPVSSPLQNLSIRDSPGRVRKQLSLNASRTCIHLIKFKSNAAYSWGSVVRASGGAAVLRRARRTSISLRRTKRLGRSSILAPWSGGWGLSKDSLKSAARRMSGRAHRTSSPSTRLAIWDSPKLRKNSQVSSLRYRKMLSSCISPRATGKQCPILSRQTKTWVVRRLLHSQGSMAQLSRLGSSRSYLTSFQIKSDRSKSRDN